MKILLAFGNKRLAIGCLQFVQIYIRNNLIYRFDKKKTFRPKYIARNTRLSQKHKKHNENSMGRGGSLTKGK